MWYGRKKDKAVSSLATHFNEVRSTDIVGVVKQSESGNEIQSDRIENKNNVDNDKLDKGASESGGVTAKIIGSIDGVGCPRNSDGSDGVRGIEKNPDVDNSKTSRSKIDDGKKTIEKSNKTDVADNNVGRGNDTSVATFTEKHALSVGTSAGKTITLVKREKTQKKPSKKSSPAKRQSPRNVQPMQTRCTLSTEPRNNIGFNSPHMSHQPRTKQSGQIKMSTTQSDTRPQPHRRERPQKHFSGKKRTTHNNTPRNIFGRNTWTRKHSTTFGSIDAVGIDKRIKLEHMRNQSSSKGMCLIIIAHFTPHELI